MAPTTAPTICGVEVLDRLATFGTSALDADFGGMVDVKEFVVGVVNDVNTLDGAI